MALVAEERWGGETVPQEAPPRRGGGLIRLVPPAAVDHPALLEWALAVAADADRRVEELEARLAYFEGLSITDELTRALNRRGFLHELSRAVAVAARGGAPGAVILCDLDGFKGVNDRAGHAAGDETLKRVAALFLRRVRQTDAVARLGGDEFAVLLAGASAASARRKCQSLARALTELPSPLPGDPAPLTASFGVAAYHDGEEPEALLHRADMAMYAAKRRRRRAAAVLAPRG
jgi:diguanylate cyclase (GGDEF)-like protein